MRGKVNDQAGSNTRRDIDKDNDRSGRELSNFNKKANPDAVSHFEEIFEKSCKKSMYDSKSCKEESCSKEESRIKHNNSEILRADSVTSKDRHKSREKTMKTDQIQMPIVYNQSEAILKNLQMQHDVSTVSSVDRMDSKLFQEVEKILATNEAFNSNQRVDITLKDGLLKDTKAIIFKDENGLNVLFETGAGESAEILNTRSGDLRSQLMERFPNIKDINVEVEYVPSRNDQENQGQSRQNSEEQEKQQDQEPETEQVPQ